MESLNDSLNRFQSPKSAPRTYFEEQVAPYLKYMLWDDKSLVDDQSAFWSTAHKYNKCMPSGFLTRLLEWAAHKDKNGQPLHVKQIIRAMNKQVLTRKAKGLI